MFNNLNTRTRNVVNKILSKEPVLLGGKEIESLSDMELRVLYVIASNLRVIVDKAGEPLAEQVIELIKNTEKVPDPKKFTIEKVTNEKTKQWMIGKIRVKS